MEILNDRILAEDILANGFTYRKCVFKQLQSVIRYLTHGGKDKEEIITTCADVLREFDKDNLRYADVIDIDNNPSVLEGLYNDSLKHEYKDDKYVYFSNQEMNYIDELKSTRSQRMLFTVMCLLKFQRERMTKERNFISTASADIMRMAGTTSASSIERRQLWNEILTTGKAEIFVTQKGEDVCYRPLYKNGENECYTIPVSNTVPFGEQWVMLTHKDMFQCVDCGKWFKRNGLRKTSRCKECNEKYRRNYIKEKVREGRKRKKEGKLNEENDR